MELHHIELSHLSVSKANMRHARKAPDISDILPSVRARGVLVPLLVRPGVNPGSYEIVAGRRRYHAALKVAEAVAGPHLLPCAVMGEGDDAAALEASLIENHARSDPDEVTLWESFTRLVREGRGADEIAGIFALPLAKVRRILALGNLLPAIRNLYRAGEIEAGTVRALTLASRDKQQQWLALHRDPEARAPRGSQLKAWLLGGQSIPTDVALFDLASYPGTVITDLFDEHGYFADSEQFWTAQMAAVEAHKAAYLAAGWSGVEVVPPASHFQMWEHAKVGKAKGGRVYIVIDSRGSVTCHEGYLTRREAERGAAAEQSEAMGAARPVRSELTQALNDYVDAHRHIAVQAALAAQPGLALRIMVAHAICGSPLWQVRLAAVPGRSAATEASVAATRSDLLLEERRVALLAMLDWPLDAPALATGQTTHRTIAALTTKLIGFSDALVMEMMALVMAETLAPGTELIELIGGELGIDMRDCWEADQTFFELLRDREVLGAVVAEVAGEAAAKAHAQEKGSTLKRLIGDCLAGANGRAKCERWVPRWLSFPPGVYTARGGVGSVTQARRLAGPGELDGPDGEEFDIAAD